MSTYSTFASHLLFKKIHQDELGSFYRAAAFDASGITRKVWLRVFDGQAIPREDLAQSVDLASQIAAKLQAATIAEDVTYHVQDGVVGQAQKWVGGRPLNLVFDKARQEGFPVPVDNALLILEKLSLAMSAGLTMDVGGSSLVHGFLHPGLVLITNDGEAVVSGFGLGDALVGALDSNEAMASAAPYLAPEVVMSRTTGKRGDIYSLGAILFHLVTGETLPADPAAREGVLENAEMAYDGEPLPADIKALIGQAIAPRPEDRFSSASDFKKELDKLLYGGNYSPTTFNLALFMDRLFRSEIEEDESAALTEDEVDVAPYLRPEPEPEVEEELPPPPAKAPNRALLFAGIGAVAIVAIVVGIMLGRGGSPEQVAVPTPTAEELAAQRQAQEDRIRQLAAQIAEEKLREKEEQITKELQDSQKRIDALQSQLRAAQQDASSSAEAERRQEELQRQIEAEQEAQKRQQEELEKAAQEAKEQAQREAAAELAAQEAAEEAAEDTEVASLEPTPVVEQAAQEAQPARTKPDPAPTATPADTVRENQFVPPEQVDTLPAVLREEAVTWPRTALHSRRKGIVVLQVTVNSRGLVDDVKILRADEDGFGIPQAVIEAARQYRFKPGTKDGVNIKTYATVTKPYSFRGR